MGLFIVKLDHFDPDGWPALAAPYRIDEKQSHDTCREMIRQFGTQNCILLVGSQSPRTLHRFKRKALALVKLQNSIYRTDQIVDPQLVRSEHYSRVSDGNFRMPYCVPYSQVIVFSRPYKDARELCGEELVDNNNRRNWRIELSKEQTEKAMHIIRTIKTKPQIKDKPKVPPLEVVIPPETNDP